MGGVSVYALSRILCEAISIVVADLEATFFFDNVAYSRRFVYVDGMNLEGRFFVIEAGNL